MLNNNGERELAYVVKVDNITPMDADRLECAHIGGWHCVVGKGEFKTGDCAIYFEVDSQLPEVEPFTQIEFLKSKKYKIRIQKIRGEYSQGLLMPATMFGWNINEDYVVDSKGRAHSYTDESRFLTKELGVTYAVAEDNARKAPSQDRYKAMAQRHSNLFKKKWVRKLMRHEWGRRLMFLFFGKKRDKKTEWPSWVQKTDEERLENCPWVLESDAKWIATEKIDGSSTTFTLKGRGRRQKFYFHHPTLKFHLP